MPYSSSITGLPSPRVAGRPAPPAKAGLRPAWRALAAAGREAPARAGCGFFVGFLVRGGADCAMRHLSLPAFMQVRGLTEWAPAIGLEPITCRLTAGRSAD